MNHSSTNEKVVTGCAGLAGDGMTLTLRMSPERPGAYGMRGRRAISPSPRSAWTLCICQIAAALSWHSQRSTGRTGPHERTVAIRSSQSPVASGASKTRNLKVRSIFPNRTPADALANCPRPHHISPSSRTPAGSSARNQSGSVISLPCRVHIFAPSQNARHPSNFSDRYQPVRSSPCQSIPCASSSVFTGRINTQADLLSTVKA